MRITDAGLTAIGVGPDVRNVELGGLTPAEFEEEQNLAQAALDAGIDLSLDPEDDHPRDECNGVDPALVIGDLAEGSINEPASPEMALLPTAPTGDSLAAFPPSPPSSSGEALEGLQRQPVSQQGPIGRQAAALRMAAAMVLTAWDAPERDGLDKAVSALRQALDASPRATREARPPRDPALPRPARTGTKQEAVLALLRRDEGTTIAEIIDDTGWQPHTVRGFLAGLKRRGITVEVLERVRHVGPNMQDAKGSYSIYRIAEAG